ncbi:hypothetical protein [Streptomyces sulphureus]|uniref:hypothetical protein n=1 Tax=Streptomyces sulphureus TaxID=47758 RepID=UPI0003728DD2|nr:hypothetical protein [Streptomyces sulphureus]
MYLGITGQDGLPEQTELLVREALLTEVERFDAEELVGVSCLAEGPEAWFAEAVVAHGAELETVEPAKLFRQGLSDVHRTTYDRLVARARAVHRTGMTIDDDHARSAASGAVLGLADHLLAVWDGTPGTTADVVDFARTYDVPVSIVWPQGAHRV